MELTIILKRFELLSPFELYDGLQLRNEVFVIEQNCLVPELDDKDKLAHHLFFYQGDRLVAYSRLLPAGLSFKEMSIGRVVTRPEIRGTGIGKQLMEESIRAIYAVYGQAPIRIAAQLYAEMFYKKCGFKRAEEPFMLDGIEHIQMVRP